MKPLKRLTIAVTLSSVLLPALVSAQELPRRLYSSPLAVTAADVLRVVVVPLPLRLQGPSGLCNVEATVEILDALDMSTVLAGGPVPISVGSSLQSDFTVAVGPAPARRAVVVRTTIARTPSRTAEQSTLHESCPLRASIQVFDSASGRTRIFDPRTES